MTWLNEDITRLQRHHTRRMWSCPLRELSSQMLYKVLPKIMKHTSVQDKRGNFKLKSRTLMSRCPLREHTSQSLNNALPKIMEHALVPGEYDKCKYVYELVQ